MLSGRVKTGDVYWGGEPAEDMLVAKNLARHGMYNDSTELLEALQEKRKLDSNGKALLASAYISRAKTECFSEVNPAGSGIFLLKEDCDWRSNIDKAIALDDGIRKDWVVFLVGLIQRDLGKGILGNYTDATLLSQR